MGLPHADLNAREEFLGIGVEMHVPLGSQVPRTAENTVIAGLPF